MKLGWHAGNTSPFTNNDWALMRALPPQMLVFLPHYAMSAQATTPDEIGKVQALYPYCEYFVRPYMDPKIFLAEGIGCLNRFSDAICEMIERYLQVIPAAQFHLQIFNEQNMPEWVGVGRGYEGFGTEPEQIKKFSLWYNTLFDSIQKVYPKIPIGWSPLTPGNFDVWFEGDQVAPYYMHGREGCRWPVTESQRQTAIQQALCASSLRRAYEHYSHVYIHNAEDAWSKPHYGLRYERELFFSPTETQTWITEGGFPTEFHMNLPWAEKSLLEWLQLLEQRGTVAGVAFWMLGKTQWGEVWKGKVKLAEKIAALFVRDTVDERAVIARAHANILPYNPDAALAKAGIGRGLIVASHEISFVSSDGSPYIQQSFRNPSDDTIIETAYVPVGRWTDIVWITHSN